MSKGTIALLASALAIALVGSGCGDSGTSTGTIAAREIPKPVYLKKANAICAKTYEHIKEEFLKYVEGRRETVFNDLDSITEYADTILIPAKQQEVEELKALGSPKGEEGQARAIIEAYEEGIEVAEEDPPQAVTSPTGAFVQATDRAKAYGLEECKH